MQKRAFSAFSDASAILKTSSPFGMKFGPGGRSSNSGITATVFGGTGFVGRYVLSELGAIGTRAYVPYRGCELEPRHIKPMFDVGQLGLVQFSGRDEESIVNSLKYSDVVINLIGKHYETKHFVPTRRADGNLSRVNFDFEEVHVKIPQTIARLAKENGVKALIHMSALSADVNSASQWSQSKARGELAVRKEFPDAIIVKPSTIFGAEDRVLNWIAETMKRSPLGFPLLNGGQNVVQPVYVGDLGKAVKEIVFGHERFKGRDFQLVGPHEYTYKELAEYVADVTYQPSELVDIHPTLARLAGTVLEQTINPFLTRDMVEQMLVDNVAKKDDSLLSFKELDIEPRAVDRMAFDYMHRFRAGGHFLSVQGYH